MRKRMTKLLGFILAVLAAAAFISCEEEIPFNGKYSGEKLVLFSTVNPDSGRIAVSVSSSRFFLDKDQNYQGRMVSGAIVTVRHAARAVTVPLAGGFQCVSSQFRLKILAELIEDAENFY